jgi:hypothetical protein
MISCTGWGQSLLKHYTHEGTDQTEILWTKAKSSMETLFTQGDCPSWDNKHTGRCFLDILYTRRRGRRLFKISGDSQVYVTNSPGSLKGFKTHPTTNIQNPEQKDRSAAAMLSFVVVVCSLFNDAFQWLGLYSVEWRVVSEWWIGMDFEGRGCGLNLGYYPSISLERLRKTTETSVGISRPRF